MPRLRALDLPVVVSEFASSLNRETDFGREARSIVLFRAALADVPDLCIPGVVAECSRGAVLTLEFSTADDRAANGSINTPRCTRKRCRRRSTLSYGRCCSRSSKRGCSMLTRIPAMCSSSARRTTFTAGLRQHGRSRRADARVARQLLLEAVEKGDARAATEAYLEMAPASEGVNRAALMVDMKAALI